MDVTYYLTVEEGFVTWKGERWCNVNYNGGPENADRILQLTDVYVSTYVSFHSLT
jgi:hypothetical protein